MKQEFFFVAQAESQHEVDTGCMDAGFGALSEEGKQQVAALAELVKSRGGDFYLVPVGTDERRWESELDRYGVPFYCSSPIEEVGVSVQWVPRATIEEYREEMHRFLEGTGRKIYADTRATVTSKLLGELGDRLTEFKEWAHGEFACKTHIVYAHELTLLLIATWHFGFSDEFLYEHRIKPGSWFRVIVEVDETAPNPKSTWHFADMEMPQLEPRFRDQP